MLLNRLGVVCLAFCSVAGAGTVAAQPAPRSGRLEGVVVRHDGSGVGGVLVLIEELRRSELTDPTYGVFDLNGRYRATKHVTAGADIANLLDNDHYEAFGADLLGRRALGQLTYSW